jgi:hypothetical protein
MSKDEWIAFFISRDDYKLFKEKDKLSVAWEEALKTWKSKDFLFPLFKCKKDFIERYHLRGDSWWADITISSDGVVNVQSDYGDYHYYWSSFGDDIKNFLIGCDYGYLYGKFGMGLSRVFNQKETIKRIRREILEYRRDVPDPQSCRTFYDITKNLENENFFTTQDWAKAIEDSDLARMYDYDLSSMPCVTEDNQQLKTFLMEIWPKFIEVLKNEKGYE